MASTEDKAVGKETTSSWKDSIYNPRTGELLGRTASSWGEGKRPPHAHALTHAHTFLLQHAAVNWRVCCDIHGARKLIRAPRPSSSPGPPARPLPACHCLPASRRCDSGDSHEKRKEGGEIIMAKSTRPTFLRARTHARFD